MKTGIDKLREIDPRAIDALNTCQRQLDMDGVEVGVSRQALDEVLHYITHLEAKITRLREALRPFALDANRYDPPETDDNTRLYSLHSKLRIGDLRRARAALEKTEMTDTIKDTEMTDTIKDGGSAFPVQESETMHGAYGMTLRDWFAGQALAGELANSANGKWGSAVRDDHLAHCAEFMYRFADAMIAERSKP